MGREEELVQDLFLRSSAVSSGKEEEEPEEKIETECSERQGGKKRERKWFSQKLREKFISRTKGGVSLVENY